MTQTGTDPAPRPAGRMPVLAVLLSLGVLCAFQVLWALDIRDGLAATQKSAERMDAAAKEVAKLAEQIDEIDRKLTSLANDQSFLVDDLQKLKDRTEELVRAFEEQNGKKVGGVAEPPQLDWTEPALFEAARKSAAEVGIELTKDEVRVPSRFVLREGPLDYFAVLKGGKEYESVIALLGNTPSDQRRPKDFGVRLNNAIQALGMKRGRPVRFTQQGVAQAQGDPIYLFLEWDEDGRKVLARAEDLLWDRMDGVPMPHGKWVYVGSQFVEGDTPGQPVFAADLTAEAIASYSSPATIIDNVSRYAGDNRAYLVATPRIPKDVDACTLVIRRVDREPTKTFPAPPPEKKDDGGEKKKEDGGGGGQGR